jgi:sigma-E factor negative regulatory protein RseA
MQSILKKAQEDSDVSFEESLSAWVDGEQSDVDASDFSSEQARRNWDTYHLIGDVLRNSELAVKPSAAFHARLSRALDAELPIVAPQRRRSPFRLGLSSMAVVAAVATVAWVAQPYVMSGPATGSFEVRALADASINETPVLRDYVEAHRQMAGPNAVRQVSFDGGVGR